MATVWHVYCDDREFGIDYPTAAAARAVRDTWAKVWPTHRYTYRKAR